MDPKQFEPTGGLRVAPGSEPNPLLSDGSGEAAAGALQRLEVAAGGDHPLSTQGDSRWHAYFQARERGGGRGGRAGRCVARAAD